MLFCTSRSVHFGFLIAALLLAPALTQAAAKSHAAPQTAAQPLIFPDAFRAVIERGIANGAYRGVAVGVIEGKQHKTLYFGHRDSATSAPPDDNSLFEIGAVSEIFTGLLLAQAAIEGKLHLRDPVRDFLAANFPFADAATGQISLDALATQQSGLPARAANMFPANLDDPYAEYAAEDLLAYLAQYPGSSDISSPRGYSVLNSGLLGLLLGRAYVAPFGDVLSGKILAPLGMSHTGFDGDTDLLPGHARGEVTPAWHYGVLAAAAGLRASLPDLVEFLQHNLTPDDSPLRAALLLARQPRAADDADQIGLGWNVREVNAENGTWPLIWRASDTAGFASFIGFRTDKQRAIVLLGNASEDLAELGMAWLTETTPPSAPHGYTTAAAGNLAIFPGLYALASGNELIVRAKNGSLSVQLPGAWPQRLRAVDQDVFATDDNSVALTFMREVDEINGLVLHTHGNHISAQRLSASAPRVGRGRIDIGNAKIDEICGDYRVDPGTWLRISRRGSDLSMQLSMGERLEIFPYTNDRFADSEGAVDLAVHRDTQGRIERLILDLAGGQRDAMPLHVGPSHGVSR